MPFFSYQCLLEGGVRGGGGRWENRNTAHGSARILQYRITIYPNTETAITNGKKVDVAKSSLQIEIILLCQFYKIKVCRCQAYDKHKIIAIV